MVAFVTVDAISEVAKRPSSRLKPLMYGTADCKQLHTESGPAF